MSDNQIEAYLEKYKITSRELLEIHLEEIKMNTVVNKDIVFSLTEILCDEALFFKFFCAKNKNIGSPFFLDEILEILFTPATKENKTEEDILNELRADLMTTPESNNECKKAIRKEDLKNTISHTGGTVFEKLQDSPLSVGGYYNYLDSLCKSANIAQEKIVKNIEFNQKDFEEGLKKAQKQFNTDSFPNIPRQGKIITYNTDKIGKKESQTVKKAPVFTYCKQMKNAVEALALRSLYGHERYEKGDDWENFSRVENGEFEYSNAEFRHALEIGADEDEKQHLIAAAWNAVARLELYLRKNK